MMRLVIGLLIFVVLVWLMAMFGLGSPLMMLVALAVAMFIAFRFSGGGSASNSGAKTAGFVSDFSHDNIAINSQTGKLWVRGADGKSAVLDKDDVLRWNLAYISRGAVHTNNRIELHVRDLSRPMWSVPFERHSDAWRWSEGRNYAEAEEWQSRLTTWLKS